MRISAVIVLLSLTAGVSSAQERLFGSFDDPAEQPSRTSWVSEGSLGVFAGLSLIGPQWRSKGKIIGEVQMPSFNARISAALRAGLYGAFEEDIDEPYDLVRTIEHVHMSRWSGETYLRLGPLDRTRLGLGQVVNFHTSWATWDERSVGVEFAARGTHVGVEGFLSDVRLDNLFGGRVNVHPLGFARARAASSFELAVAGIYDRGPIPEEAERFGALTIETQIEAWRSGAFGLFPFASYSWSRHRGQGLFVGADLRSDNFIDLARIHFRVALHFNGTRFLPGYVGPTWNVHGPYARVLKAEPSDGATSADSLAGIHVSAVPKNEALETELRILIFDRFEFWYRFVRNFASTELSEFNLRMFANAGNLRLMIGQDRGGLAGIFSLFDALGDLNLLRFEIAYRLGSSAWVLVEARYTYETAGRVDGLPRFRVERRFDPLVGMKLTF